ncbi:MAG: Mov34/MPN/PAD-1 family protein, partial [Acidobacteriota bacterium]|nr:Mov34/MPN/PAD-1 family protein [Acidobacteriota bacterium]
FLDPGCGGDVIRTYTSDWSPWGDSLYWRFMFWSPPTGGTETVVDTGGENPVPQKTPFKPNCPPTGTQLARNPQVQRILNNTWRDSQHGSPQNHEEGGWLYWNPDTSRIISRRAARGSEGSINLSNPPYIRGAFVIAEFHSHPYATSVIPTLGYTGPSGQDERLAYKNNIPSLVISQEGIWTTGPARWGSNPERAGQSQGQFPGNSIDSRKNCP